MRHIMIDHENVHLKKMPDLGREACCLWLFTGVLQDKLPTELIRDLLNLQREGLHAVHLISVAHAGNNALDFCLSYQMGRIAMEYGAKNVSFCVYSKDKGFDALIKHMLEQKHCAHAVRSSDERFLALSEAEWCRAKSPATPQPLKSPPPPRSSCRSA